MKRLIARLALLLMTPAFVSAQTAEPPYRGQGHLTFGLGIGTGVYQPAVIRGVSFGGEGFLYKGLGVGGEAELAILSPSENAWVGSAGLSYHFGRHAKPGKVDPFGQGGISVVGPTEKGGGRGSPAGNFGGGVNVWIAPHAALRLEVRDVVGATFWPYSHYVSFRFGVTFR